MRSIHFTWEDSVHLATRGVSLVIYKCIKIIHIPYMFFKLNKELKITFHSITIQVTYSNFSYVSTIQILKYKLHYFLLVCFTSVRLLEYHI